MDHKADVGFVDAHAKGVCSHHDGGAVEGEILLVFAPLPVVQAGVVARGGKAGGAQGLADLLDRLARGAVDDAAFVRAGGQEVLEPAQLVALAAHVKEEVGPVKAGDDPAGVGKPQKTHNVLPHLGRGRGGKGREDRPAGQRADKGGNIQIIRPEILAPLADAVGLVHRKQGDALRAGKGEKALGQKPLGRDVHQPVGALPRPAQHLPLLGGGERGVEKGRGDAGVLQGRHLVFHKGDQGRDHQRQPLEQHGRELIADAFAAAGWHDAKGIAPGKNGVNQRLLPRPEGRKPEILPQGCVFVHVGLLV